MAWLTYVAARPDGALLGIGTESGRFSLWSVRDKTLVHSFEAGDFVARARWTPDGQRLLVALQGGRLLVRDGDGRTAVGEIDTRHGELRGLAVHPAGTAWATCGRDIAVRLWDPVTLGLRLELVDGKTMSNAVGFTKNSVVAGYDDGYFVAWSEDGKEKLASGAIARWPPVASLAVHPSGERVVFGGGRGGMGEVVVGETWTAGTQWKTTPPKPIAVNAIDFAPDGRFVAAFSDDTAQLFKSTNDSFGTSLGSAFYHRSPKPEWRQDFIVSAACFIPGSDLIATSHFDGNLRLWKGWQCVETIRI
jgi:WD40 repeat protein